MRAWIRAALTVLALSLLALAILAGTYGALLLAGEDSEDGAPHEVGRYLVASALVAGVPGLVILGASRRRKRVRP
jgi:hypothetical protein